MRIGTECAGPLADLWKRARWNMITSTSNQKVKRIVQLNKKAGERKKEGVFAAEGIKMFLEAPEGYVEEVYVSEKFLMLLESQEDDGRGVREKLEENVYETVSGEVFAKMSDTQSPQGILCVVRQRRYALENMLKGDRPPLFLVLENLQDPGNLGTVLRSGEAAGADGIVMSRDTVDIYNPKVIRATMGSVYRMPFCYVEDLEDAIGQMKQAGTEVFAAHLEGKKSYDQCDYRKASAFLIGNEGKGLTERVSRLADVRIRIPMEGKVESLNAAVAASLLAFEAARQRRG